MTSRRRRSATALSLLTVAALGLAACGGDDDDNDSATNTTRSGGTVEAQDAEVTMVEYAYQVSGQLGSNGTLRVKNAGAEFHMMGLGLIKPGKTFADAQAALESEDEADDGEVVEQIAMPGHFIGPGSEAGITARGLTPGNYVMVCYVNVEGEEMPHVARGMIGQLEVVDNDAAAPDADATYVASSGKAMTGPASLSAGRNTLKIEHTGDGGGDLEPGIFRLNNGTTVAQFAEAMKVFDEGPLPRGAAGLLPGEIVLGMFDFGDRPSVFLDVDLEPGRYVIVANDGDVENPPLVPAEMIEISVS
jgi:hypothetical protein